MAANIVSNGYPQWRSGIERLIEWMFGARVVARSDERSDQPRRTKNHYDHASKRESFIEQASMSREMYRL